MQHRPMQPLISVAAVMQVLSLTVICFLIASCSAAVVDRPQQQQQTVDKNCTQNCAICQSVTKIKTLQLCTANRLTPCGCQQYEIDHAISAAADRTVPDRCGNKYAAGFCAYGQLQDPNSKCPTELCSAPNKCPQNWQQRCPADLWCPRGHATDSNGCPQCRCACNDRLHTAAGCSAACTKRGLEFEVTPPLTEGDCYSCICKQSANATALPNNENNESQTVGCVRQCSTSCGPYGFTNATKDQRGCIADCSCKCPATRDYNTCPRDCAIEWSADAYGCQRCSCTAAASRQSQCPKSPACSNSCGTYGYKVTSDGCRASCQCQCPSVKCPSGCKVYTVVKDEFGCNQCRCMKEEKRQSSCSQLSCPSCGPHPYANDTKGCGTCSCKCPTHDSHCPSSSCLRWSRDEYGCAKCSVCKADRPCLKNKLEAFKQLCPSKCNDYTLSKDASGCYSCNCKRQCPPEPQCMIGCGQNYRRKTDASGCVTTCDCDCPAVDLAQCQQNCRNNATLVKDVYGCNRCKCEPTCKQDFHCSNNCGSYGYQADSRGCRKNCNCNCPPTNCNCINDNCNCPFGLVTDQFGCSTCKCKSNPYSLFPQLKSFF